MVYRSRGVRGPTSALTEFLRSRGINAREIQLRHARRQRDAEEAAAATAAAATSTITTRPTRQTATQAAGPSKGKKTSSKKAPPKKRKKPDDDDDADFNPYKKAQSLPGQIAFCDSCNCRFTVTPYSKPGTKEGGLLCTPCGKKTAQQDKDSNKRKPIKRQKKIISKALLETQGLGARSLRDLAIDVVAKHIDEVGQVMDCLQFGRRDVDKICQIISRSRRLTDHTLKLFLESGITRLSLYDCTYISTNELRMIAATVPTLRYLMLRFCGSMTDEVLDYYTTQLNELRGIELGGPFLVTKNCYIEFFKARGNQLEEVTLTDTFRVDADVISALVDCCPKLKELRLKQIVRLDNECVRMLTGLTELKVLEISDPGEDVEDDAVIDVLNSLGSGLRELNLSGCVLLTDRVALAIRECCPRLYSLSLAEMEEITDEGIFRLFTNWDINPGLQTLDVSRIRKLATSGITAILAHSGRTLETLNVNSCDLEEDSWQLWDERGQMKRLRSLDLGFIQSVNDTVVEGLCTHVCPSLTEIKVFGNHHITEAIQLPEHITIIGRETE